MAEGEISLEAVRRELDSYALEMKDLQKVLTEAGTTEDDVIPLTRTFLSTNTSILEKLGERTTAAQLQLTRRETDEALILRDTKNKKNTLKLYADVLGQITAIHQLVLAQQQIKDAA